MDIRVPAGPGVGPETRRSRYSPNFPCGFVTLSAVATQSLHPRSRFTPETDWHMDCVDLWNQYIGVSLMSLAEQHAAIPDLNSANRETYLAVFRHPIPHNLLWGDVRRLLTALASVTTEHNGNLVVSRGGRTLHLPDHPSHDQLSLSDVKHIRDFLEKTETPSTTGTESDGRHWLVVVDHSSAQIYRTEMHGDRPIRVVPHDPEGKGRHVHLFRRDGKHRPVRTEFYEAVAGLLRGADQVLVFGHGTGPGAAMDELQSDLEQHHPEIARRVIGRVAVDLAHTTEDQLLAKAREFYSGRSGG